MYNNQPTMFSMVASLISQVLDFVILHPLFSGVMGALCYYALSAYMRKLDLKHIPVVGSTRMLSYYDGYQDLYRGRELVQEGYRKFRGSAFRIPLPDKWHIILASPDLVNELKSAKESDLSINDAIADRMQAKYTIGENITSDTYHIAVVRSPLTRNLATRFDDVYDEIIHAFNDSVPANEKDWLPISVVSATQQIVCRTSNRLFLGLPICREPEWIRLNIQFTVDTFKSADNINMFPNWLKPFAGQYLSPTTRALQLGRKFLGSVITERLQMDNEYGKDWDGRPNDLISWLLDHAQGEERTTDNIILRLLAVNLAAIHTSSSSFTQALFYLAACPEYVAPMREEVLSVVEREGWTKAALNKMRKVDSFLKETARMEGLGAVTMNRKVVNPAGFTFSNGLHLPYGAHVGCASFGVHHDLENYEDPFTFDGFRFSKIRDDGGEGLKHQMVSTSLDYLHFGHGKHACPGRFFAANELKLMLAHMLVTYDLRLEGDSKPINHWLGMDMSPDAKARILFRRLQT